MTNFESALNTIDDLLADLLAETETPYSTVLPILAEAHAKVAHARMLHDNCERNSAAVATVHDMYCYIIRRCCSGAKIDAIKYFRERTGMSLKQSKNYVDSIFEIINPFLAD